MIVIEDGRKKNRYFLVEISEIKKCGWKGHKTDYMNQRHMFCNNLCCCEKNKRPEPSQKPMEMPAGAAQIQPGWCLDGNPVTGNNLIGQAHQKELKRALEVRVNKWKSHTWIQVCWPLPHYFQLSRNMTHFQDLKSHVVEWQSEFSKGNLTLRGLRTLLKT